MVALKMAGHKLLNGVDNMTEELPSIIDYSEDISDAEQPEPLPMGDYPVTIRTADARESINTGRRYAAVGCYIAPEDFPADYPAENAPDGKTIVYRRISLEDGPQERFRMRRFCEAIGAPMSSKIDLNDWLGLEATAVIDVTEYEGMLHEEIRRLESS